MLEYKSILKALRHKKHRYKTDVMFKTTGIYFAFPSSEDGRYIGFVDSERTDDINLLFHVVVPSVCNYDVQFKIKKIFSDWDYRYNVTVVPSWDNWFSLYHSSGVFLGSADHTCEYPFTQTIDIEGRNAGIECWCKSHTSVLVIRLKRFDEDGMHGFTYDIESVPVNAKEFTYRAT